MIKIKVRAWHLLHKKMYSAEELGKDQMAIMPDGRGFANISGENPSMTVFARERMIPLQWTGLKDKKGNEIYESDIFEFGCGNEGCNKIHKGIIVWIDELACYGVNQNNTIFPLQIPFNPLKIEEGIGLIDIKLVIGNVFENPELLNEKESIKKIKD